MLWLKYYEKVTMHMCVLLDHEITLILTLLQEKTIYDLWFGGMYCWSYSPSSLRKVTWVGRGPQPKLEDVNRHLSRSFPSIVNWFYFDRFEYSPEADDARWPSLYDVGVSHLMIDIHE